MDNTAATETPPPEGINRHLTQNFLADNIEVLRQKNLQFGTMVEAKFNNLKVETIPFEVSKEGECVASERTKEGRAILLHSRYYPRQEAEKFITEQGTLANLVICFGFGNGFHVREILKRLDPNGKLIVVGLNEELLLLNFKYLDLRDIFSDDRIRLIIDKDIDHLAEMYYQSLDWHHLKGVNLITHGPSRQLYDQEYKIFVEKVKYLTRQSQGNLVTVMKNGEEFQANTLRNLPNFITKPGVKHLFNCLEGKHPAILVSAGPSLDKNVHLLHDIKGKVMIIATDTALKPLLSHKIEPDFVVAADPCYLNSLDFQGLPKVSTVLVCEPMASPDIFKWHKGPQMVCSFGDIVVTWMETFTEQKGRLFAWGSISTTAFDLARKFNADPIIFIGQDLSFPFGKTHCRGTFHDERWGKQCDYLNTFEMRFTNFSARGKRALPDLYGQTVYTDEQMNIYRQWFENQIERTTAKMVNATEGGVLKKGYEILSLAEAIQKYCQGSYPVAETIKKALSRDGEIKLEALHTEIATLRRMIRDIGEKSEFFLEKTRRFLSFGDRELLPQLRGPERETFEKIIEFYDTFRKTPCLSHWYSNVYQKDIHRFISRVPKNPREMTLTGKEFGVAYQEALESIVKFVAFLQPIMEDNFKYIDGVYGDYQKALRKNQASFAGSHAG